MKAETFLNERVALWSGDSRDVLRGFMGESFHSVVCDPPYALVSIAKRYGKPGAAAVKHGTDGLYARASSGFMGKQWDTGETAFAVSFWAEVLRVLKPGGHVVAFSGTRTYHRVVCAIEDAGFEIRDQLAWVYGSGFPKSHDVAKGIDKAAGRCGSQGAVSGRSGSVRNAMAGDFKGGEYHEYLPATEDAASWQGWGTALKPAWEPIVLARKPLGGTVAEAVIAHGTGALNIDGCRVHADDAQGGAYTIKRFKPGETLTRDGGTWKPGGDAPLYHGEAKPGRWPANILHDGSDEVIAAFPEAPGQQGVVTGDEPSSPFANVYGDMPARAGRAEPRRDGGSAARFFYSAKADANDRIGSKHPTVKPVDLMQWLCRLVTPPGGTVLDPFAGTGTTGEAAWREGFSAVLIERESEYQLDIRRRMALCMAGPEEKKREIIKAKQAGKDEEPLPLFGGPQEAAE